MFDCEEQCTSLCTKDGCLNFVWKSTRSVHASGSLHVTRRPPPSCWSRAPLVVCPGYSIGHALSCAPLPRSKHSTPAGVKPLNQPFCSTFGSHERTPIVLGVCIFFLRKRKEKRDVSQSKEHLRTMLTTHEHNPSSHQPLRVLCHRQRLATCAPATCSRTTLLLCMPKVSSISDSMRVPLGFGWTPEHSALWPMP